MVDFFDRPFTAAATGFTGSALDRADAMRGDEQAVFAARMHPGARWLMLDDLRPHCTADGALHWARRADLPEDAEHVFLGLQDGLPRFACAGCYGDDDAAPQDARAAAMHLPAGDGAVLAQARSLIDWHGRHRFCGGCGAPTEARKAGYARQCTGCGLEHFPRTDPVVIMLALHGEGAGQRALLGRQGRFPPGFMSALAGFVEHGESLEEAVRRELFEETGVRTHRVAYVASQPWPFPYSLMMGAFAEAPSDQIKVDGEEIVEARWFTRDEIAAALAGEGELQVPPPMAIAHTLLKTWIENP
ncbi:NAD(+) diphosphatase [Pacificimonas flava]|uniref:NAD(+) diphosphatase n=1 Tax=Pacificimonas flava TaxID=1234595 RepID=M2U4N7_9SPHN|nr:NAD(+) diphosphatase [Pacificimonas flava]EMD82938.1 NADH pyrophosphatase [Pacificimonas flava]MBB5280099.1 NAD+ diphosphatase [Pacificimonas flava]